jgi:hypothetical protein
MDDFKLEVITELTTMLTEFINANLFVVLMQILILGTFLVLAKVFIENFASWVLLRFDPHIKVGTLILLENDTEARVKEIRIFSITVESKVGYLSIPTRRWRDQSWTVLKDIAAINKIKPYKVTLPEE